MENLIVNINSKFRNKIIDKKASKFSYTLPYEFKHIINMRLCSFELPNVFYTISEKKNNNYFFVNDEKITLEDGNYQASTLLEYLNDELGEEIDVSINIINGKLYFDSEKEIKITFDENKFGLNHYLGFNKNSYQGTYIEGESVLNISGSKYIFLKINEIQNIIDKKVYNAFAKVLVNTDKYFVQYDEFTNFITKDKLFRSPQSFQRLDFEIVDENGELCDFGNHDISFTLEFGHIYDEKLYKKIQNYGMPNGDTRLKFLYYY